MKLSKIVASLWVISLIFSGLEGIASAQNTDSNNFKIIVTGAKHFPKGSRISIYQRGLVETPEGVDYLLKGQPFKDPFHFSGTVDDIHDIIMDVYLPQPLEPRIYIRVRFVLEPDTTTIHFTSRENYILKGGKYNNLAVNSWHNDPAYQKVQKKLRSMSYKDKREAYMKASKKARKIKNKDLEKTFQKTHDDPLAQLLIYGISFYKPSKVDLKKDATQVSDHRQAKLYLNALQKQKKVKAARKSVAVGKPYKDFKAKSLQRKTVHLADVLKQNKYVLVEFWASWCGPCRAFIPTLKKAYKKYNSSGFQIVSFSMDHERSAWKKASKVEDIPWISVSDLLAFTSPIAKMYGIRGIPFDFLVDSSTGKIVAKNLRGEELDKELNKVFSAVK